MRKLWKTQKKVNRDKEFGAFGGAKYLWKTLQKAEHISTFAWTITCRAVSSGLP